MSSMPLAPPAEQHISDCGRQSVCRVDIPTDMATLWRQLSGLSSYPSWNPFLTGLGDGGLRPGQELSVRYREGELRRVVKGKVESVEPGTGYSVRFEYPLPMTPPVSMRFAAADIDDGRVRFTASITIPAVVPAFRAKKRLASIGGQARMMCDALAMQCEMAGR